MGECCILHVVSGAKRLPRVLAWEFFSCLALWDGKEIFLAGPGTGWMKMMLFSLRRKALINETSTGVRFKKRADWLMDHSYLSCI